MLLPELEVVKASRLPIMTTLEEFYQISPGPLRDRFCSAAAWNRNRHWFLFPIERNRAGGQSIVLT
jgi:hypothetical protein